MLPRRALLTALAALPVSAFARAATPSATSPTPATLRWTRILVQPYAPKPPSADDVAAVTAAIAAFYDVPVEVADAVDLPAFAYVKASKRHRAEKLLLHLNAGRPADTAVVGLLTSDISTTKGKVDDWGILGLGLIGGGVCVASRHRCARSARSPAVARTRLAKVAVHELGHALGSDHCPTVGCVMNDAKGLIRTVDAERDLCSFTRMHLEAQGVPLTAPFVSPW